MKKNILLLIFISLLPTTCVWGMEKEQTRKPFDFSKKDLNPHEKLCKPFVEKNLVFGALFIFFPQGTLLILRLTHPIFHEWVGEFTYEKKYDRRIKIKKQDLWSIAIKKDQTPEEIFFTFIKNFNCKPELEELTINSKKIILFKGLTFPTTLKKLSFHIYKKGWGQENIEYLRKACPNLEELLIGGIYLDIDNKLDFCWTKKDTKIVKYIFEFLPRLRQLTIPLELTKEEKLNVSLDDTSNKIFVMMEKNHTLSFTRKPVQQPQQSQTNQPGHTQVNP